MNTEEAFGKVVLALAQPDRAERITAILEELGKPNDELLAACEAGRNLLCGLMAVRLSEPSRHPVVQQLEAAIAKAKGEL